MAKKSNVESKIDLLTIIVEKGFAAVADDIGGIKDSITSIKRDMATKDQVLALHTQVNSIEHQLRETKTEIRLGDLEEKVFGKVRS